MKAKILKGSRRGDIVKVSQWCNDWFTIVDSNKIFSPAALAFKEKDFKIILNHKNNGIMLKLYEPTLAPVWAGDYELTFKKKKHGTR